MDEPPIPPPPPAPSPQPGWTTTQPRSQTYWGEAEPAKPPPPSGTEYAGVGRRFAAWLLDLIPLSVLTVVAFAPVGITFFDLISDLDLDARASRAEVQAVVSASFSTLMPGILRASAIIQIGAIAYIAGTWLLFGRSPGMALLGIRIVREEDGGRPGIGRVIVRYAGYLLSSALLLLGYAWAIFDSRKQAWHDKLAGTLVVRDALPMGMGAYPAAPIEVPRAQRRPSIGVLVETALTWFRRSPDDLLSSLAFILIPATIVQLPLIAAVYVATQEQTRETMNGMLNLFATASDPIAMAQYNARTLAATGPVYAIAALLSLVSGVTATIVLGACTAAYAGPSSTGPAPDVGRTVVARLPALTAIGFMVGVVSAIGVLLVGLPAIDAATRDGAFAVNTGLVAVAVLTLFVATPMGAYGSVIWILAVVAVVREDLGVWQAVRRARRLARQRTRWLLGVLFVTGLVYVAVVLPFGTLPIGLLSDAYLDGSRLPIVLAVTVTGALTLFAIPALFLVYVEAYRAAEEDAAREPLAS